MKEFFMTVRRNEAAKAYCDCVRDKPISDFTDAERDCYEAVVTAQQIGGLASHAAVIFRGGMKADPPPAVESAAAEKAQRITAESLQLALLPEAERLAAAGEPPLNFEQYREFAGRPIRDAGPFAEFTDRQWLAHNAFVLAHWFGNIRYDRKQRGESPEQAEAAIRRAADAMSLDLPAFVELLRSGEAAPEMATA